MHVASVTDVGILATAFHASEAQHETADPAQPSAADQAVIAKKRLSGMFFRMYIRNGLAHWGLRIGKGQLQKLNALRECLGRKIAGESYVKGLESLAVLKCSSMMILHALSFLSVRYPLSPIIRPEFTVSSDEIF
jgi:hypothetical protein